MELQLLEVAVVVLAEHHQVQQLQQVVQAVVVTVALIAVCHKQVL
jgi:hypothetical protein